MKVLFLAHLFPLPLDSGGKIKSYHTLKAIAGAHEVRVLAFTRTSDETDRVAELREVCSELEVVPLERGRVRTLVDAVGSIIGGRSFIVSRDYRREMQSAFDAALADFQPDVVHIDHLQMSQYVRFGGPYSTVLDHHNVESTIIRRVAQTDTSLPTRLYAGLEWPKLRRYELDVCRKCDLVVTVSEDDGAALREMEPALDNVHSVPIGVDIDYFQPVDRAAGSRNILSIATMYWPPNVESMLHFHREILPLVRRDIPGCTLTIAGQRPVKAIRDLAADPSVRVTGYVDDPRQTAKDCGVFVVPLRSGSGVRVKILNALAMGLPVVSTPLGAEGLEVESGKHLLLADTPSDFARAVVDVLGDPDLAGSLGCEGRRLVCERYSWEIIGRRWLGLYEEHLAAEAVA